MRRLSVRGDGVSGRALARQLPLRSPEVCTLGRHALGSAVRGYVWHMSKPHPKFSLTEARVLQLAATNAAATGAGDAGAARERPRQSFPHTARSRNDACCNARLISALQHWRVAAGLHVLEPGT